VAQGLSVDCHGMQPTSAPHFVTTERLENAMRVVALLVETAGDAYWPVLERLETEHAALVSRQARRDRYLGRERFPAEPRQRVSGGGSRADKRAAKR